MKTNFRVGAVCLAIMCFAGSSIAADRKSDWIEGENREDGASRDFYNRAARLSWQNFMGDWRDAKDLAQGDAAFAVARVDDTDQGRFIEWNVIDLVREWQADPQANQGFFLRPVDGKGKIDFCSRDHPERAHHPQLLISNGKASRSLSAIADTHLIKSTYRSYGDAELLRVSGEDHALLRFDPEIIAEFPRISHATLRLYTTRQYGAAELGVFRCAQGHHAPPVAPLPGLSARYPADRGIAADPAVIFATDFESKTWAKEWTHAGEMPVIDTVSEDPAHRFEPLLGKALRVRIAKGANGALNTLFKFKPETGKEPDEIYFRYYLRLGADWNQSIEGGKMPGISGTYGRAGWGGRKSDGRNGWSARGLFARTVPEGNNPLAGLTPIGTYCYHADMRGKYGDNFIWQKGYRGYLENNRWVCIEYYVKLNTPGKHDGILRGWIDGRPAFEKTDLRYRLVDTLHIEQIWMNIYHGGKQTSPYDQHAFIDQVVVARKYIGPIPGIAKSEAR
jgi:hypothetical protein